MLFHEYLKKEIFEIVKNLLDEEDLRNDFLNINSLNVELSQKTNFGDLSSNVALVHSKFFKTSPEKLAELISIELRKNKYVEKVEVKKPGFINIFFTNLFWQNQLSQFIKLDGSYNYNLKPKSICIEFVSANPTGLMHIGHARGAVLGDAISSVLEEVGHNITKEYYINDAGEQIKKLNKTILFHVENFLKNSENRLPDDLYPGEYLKNVAKKILNKFALKKSSELKEIEKKIIDIILSDIKRDLVDLNINHDNFVSEKNISSLHNINKLKKKLLESELAYFGFQDKPKNLSGEDWEQKEQLLFCSKKFGDDSDRALMKPSGEVTYFMSDLLYHTDKIKRKFQILINIWGVDHFGYVKRLKNALSELIKDDYILDIKLTSLVNLIKNGEKLKMSKRKGNYITMREVTKEVGVDALRFMMISRNADKTIDFDFDSLKIKNKDNPVFYVQYAYARCMSVLDISKEKIKEIEIDDFKSDYLTLNEEKMLIKYICNFYNVIKSAAEHFEPHRITNYLYDLSKIFHNYWGLGNIDKKKRIITEDHDLTKSRLALIKVVSMTINKGLSLLKISSPKSM
ncbi:MAG: arginine--tRNA ligase [Rickettsiales bacterium]|nr:arginine--tRNA ligase [Rickettsiales bacterium]RPG13560.1 MAG: arginine--tRNA ligase [Pelagibacteraceae bacterium TMED195]|tara:strand:- start:3910 stop:5625 length:1716 start_codon:yes stop_codon:yes gene_type:complete